MNNFHEQIRKIVIKESQKMIDKNLIKTRRNLIARFFIDDEYLLDLKPCESELKFLLGISNAFVYDIQDAPSNSLETEIENLKLLLEISQDPLCERCRFHCFTVGHHKEHPTICGRCWNNIMTEEGEKREFF